MADGQIRFDDGAAYEDFMGRWSLLAGDAFLDWLSPATGLRWLDVGCGNGAFTELLAERCRPANVQAIDPSEGQLAFARTRFAGARDVAFQVGDAMALPFADGTFDAVASALVLFFIPDPAQGVAEMARVIRPGGGVCAYVWDIPGGGFPYFALQDEMARLGMQPMLPPSVDVARPDALRRTFEGAGLVDVETTELVVQRRFAGFEDFWLAASKGPAIAPRLSGQPDGQRDLLRSRVRERLPVAADGSIAYSARALAVRGRRRD
jgi:ubiquinone/menaquinone biosynthesis C-methylase UbiE